MLTLEERGAYNTVLDLIYQRAGAVPDEERWLAGWMGCSVKKWRLLRAALIVKGKLTTCDHNGQPGLMNDRAALELQSASTRRRVAAESGAKGGRKTAQANTKANENNTDIEATLQGSPQLLTETVTETEEKNIPSAKAKGMRPRKTSRCPDHWSPTEQDLTDAVAAGFSPGEIERELAKVRDHEFRSPRSDWSATLRNWLRNVTPLGPHESDHRIQPKPSAPDARRANTESRRNAWVDVVAERDGVPSSRDGDGFRDGGADLDMRGGALCDATGDGGGNRDGDRGPGPPFPRLAAHR